MTSVSPTSPWRPASVAALLSRIPDDDPVYLSRVARCEAEGMHPAVAAVQADKDVAYERPRMPEEERRRRHRAATAAWKARGRRPRRGV